MGLLHHKEEYMQKEIIAIDFDGTIVKHAYPRIGEPVPEALDVITELTGNGHFIILWTMRSGKELNEAVDYLTEKGVALYGINYNPSQGEWTKSPKAYAHHYIDDAALGCPLIYPDEGRPYVNWNGVRELLIEENLI